VRSTAPVGGGRSPLPFASHTMTWKQKVILFLLLLLIAACGLVVFSRKMASPQLNTVRITVLRSSPIVSAIF
jgi:hypothetical protein